ncbi:hypothetical protein HNQ69_001180 [Bartonella callosciuri]|uniref:Uncharacterized protein n=1 Tax=Bartonella callosciuri TaxID=686223 RepID=A0A840NMW4_9HYPH|nr:hypothetical protein [Bartonella callosciuri]
MSVHFAIIVMDIVIKKVFILTSTQYNIYGEEINISLIMLQDYLSQDDLFIQKIQNFSLKKILLNLIIKKTKVNDRYPH